MNAIFINKIFYVNIEVNEFADINLKLFIYSLTRQQTNHV